MYGSNLRVWVKIFFTICCGSSILHLEQKLCFMKSILNAAFFILVFFSFQGCGSLQPVSHIGDSGNRFGTAVIERPSEISPQFGSINQGKTENVRVSDIDITLIPVSAQEGFTVSQGTMLFCFFLFGGTCTSFGREMHPHYPLPNLPIPRPK